LSAGSKKSEKSESLASEDLIFPEPEEEVVEEAPEAPKAGPVYTRGPGGRLVIDESDEN
jgi:hypothetical protein